MQIAVHGLPTLNPGFGISAEGGLDAPVDFDLIDTYALGGGGGEDTESLVEALPPVLGRVEARLCGVGGRARCAGHERHHLGALAAPFTFSPLVHVEHARFRHPVYVIGVDVSRPAVALCPLGGSIAEQLCSAAAVSSRATAP